MSAHWEELRRSTDNTNRIGRMFAIGGLGALALLAYFHFYDAQMDSDSISRAAPETASPVAMPAAGTAVGQGPSIEETEVGPGERVIEADGTTHLGVYECFINGQRVISDRSCGDNAKIKVIEIAPSTPARPAVPQYQSPTPSYDASASSAGRTTAVTPSNSSACANVDREIAALNARMRQGYTSQEGEWYRERWHALHERRRDLRCGR